MRFFYEKKKNNNLRQITIRWLVVVLICLLGGVQQVFAQQTISGTVQDADGPLIAASVMVKGTKIGVVSDIKGAFKITLPEGKTILVIGYVGYVSVEVNTAAKDFSPVITLKPSSALNEVVVVGYGSQSKAKVTGAIATINMDATLGDRPVSSLGAVLQGASPGLQITTTSGAPGASTTWNIRGGTDFGSSLTTIVNKTGQSGPFIVVDGVPYNGPTNLLDPNDIESVTVLKDAGSAAIYGARSAFGVVLITTKSGKKNHKTEFTYSDNFVFAQPTNLPQKATPMQQVQAWEDGGMTVYNAGQNLATWMSFLQDYQKNPKNYPGGYTVDNNIYYQLAPTDAIHNLLGNSAFQQMHNFSLSGGSDKTTYLLSGGLTNENGILVPQANQDNFKRYNIRTVVATDVLPWLNLSLNTAYNNSTTTSPFYTNAFGDATNTPSTLPLDSIPGKAGVISTARNEILATAPIVNQFENTRITGRVVAKPFKGLTLTGDYTIDNYHNNGTIYDKKVGGFLNTYGYTAQSIGSDTYTKTDSVTRFTSINVYGTYAKSLGKHNVTLTAGYNQEQSYAEGEWTTASGMLNPDLPFISGVTGLIPYQAGDYYNEYAVRGVFGRLNYDYENKYLFQVNGRYDGSSKFPEGHQWGFFPSASAGWRITEESFMESVKPYMNELKLRASYGTVGNQNIAPYQFVPGMTVNIPNWLNNSLQVGSLNPPGLVSTTFTWETVNTKDLGADFGFFRNRLTSTFDWYQRDTNDILTTNANPVPAVLGTGAPLQNAGSLRTRGFELQVSWRDKIGKLGYFITANLFNYKSIVTNVNNPSSVLAASNGDAELYVGKTLGEIWGYTTDRFYTVNDFVPGSLNSNLRGGTLLPGLPKQNGQTPNPGDIMYKDLNGDGVITAGAGTLANPGDKRVIGNSTPQYQYSATGGVSFMNFSFSFLVVGVGKQQLLINNTLTFPNQWLTYGALYKNELNYWTPTNPNAFYGRIYTDNVNSPFQSYNQIAQTRFLLNGAFTRIQNLTLNYSFPTALISKINVTRLSVFVSVENPYTYTHMPAGMYSDVAVQGSTVGGGLGYPYMRRTSFGVNLSF
jgi:TonB-linked SusC/RagA family outer membrane protein